MAPQESQVAEMRYHFSRPREERLLVEAYDRRCCMPEPLHELVLVTGASGTGKTTLARALEEHCLSSGGLFIAGKFDLRLRPEPYAPFVVAFTEWTKLIRKKPMEEEMETNLKALDPLLLDTIPALKAFGNGQDAQTSTTDTMSTNRLQKRHFFEAVSAFLRCISSIQSPLVLFMDDLQWADSGSLDLLQSLISSRIPGFMVLGACRGNEVGINDPLAVTCRALEDNKVAITNITLKTLCKTEVQEFLSLCFPSIEDDEAALTDIVHWQTEGNLFYINQLFRLYRERGVLEKDEERNLWLWDKVQMRGRKRGVSIVMREALEQLHKDVQLLLQYASCLGATFLECHLQMIFPKLSVRDLLLAASDKDIISFSSGWGKFAHDRLQEAAYLLIPETERSRIHATIGRRLLKALSLDEFEENIFLVVNQLVSGMEELKTSRDKTRLTVLCLRAGKKAMSSSAFCTAAYYFDLAIQCLESDDQHWQSQYDLSITLFNAAAEAEYCNGRLEKMQTHVQKVFDNASCFEDKIQSYSMHVFALGAQQRFQEAIDTGFYVLGELGEPFPSRPRRLRVMFEILKTRKRLRGKTASDILKLPDMTDPEKLAAIRIMNLIYLYIFFTRQAYLPFLSTRMVDISLKYGLSGIGSSGFAMFGMLQSGVLGKIDEGNKTCQTALRILKKFDTKSFVARVYVPVYGMVFPWVQPVGNCLEPLRTAYHTGLESGDIEFAVLSATLYSFLSFFVGAPLASLRNETKTFIEQMRVHKQHGILSLLLPLAQLIDNLLGYNDDPCILSGEKMEEASFLSHAECTPHSTQFVGLHLRRLTAACFMNNVEVAFDAAEKSKNIHEEIISSLSASTHTFYDSLTALALARKSPKAKRGPLVKRARQNLKRMKKWAKHCPRNFLCKEHFLEAELTALVTGDVEKASSLYRQSMNLAEKEGFIHDQALACERMAGMLHSCGEYESELRFLRKARFLYEEWGATVKVAQLDEILDSQNREQRP